MYVMGHILIFNLNVYCKFKWNLLLEQVEENKKTDKIKPKVSSFLFYVAFIKSETRNFEFIVWTKLHINLNLL